MKDSTAATLLEYLQNHGFKAHWCQNIPNWIQLDTAGVVIIWIKEDEMGIVGELDRTWSLHNPDAIDELIDALRAYNVGS